MSVGDFEHLRESGETDSGRGRRQRRPYPSSRQNRSLPGVLSSRLRTCSLVGPLAGRLWTWSRDPEPSVTRADRR